MSTAYGVFVEKLFIRESLFCERKYSGVVFHRFFLQIHLGIKPIFALKSPQNKTARVTSLKAEDTLSQNTWKFWLVWTVAGAYMISTVFVWLSLNIKNKALIKIFSMDKLLVRLIFLVGMIKIMIYSFYFLILLIPTTPHFICCTFSSCIVYWSCSHVISWYFQFSHIFNLIPASTYSIRKLIISYYLEIILKNRQFHSGVLLPILLHVGVDTLERTIWQGGSSS